MEAAAAVPGAGRPASGAALGLSALPQARGRPGRQPSAALTVDRALGSEPGRGDRRLHFSPSSALYLVAVEPACCPNV